MLSTQLHEFHFVMDRRMKENLKVLDFYKEIGNLSGVIVRILSMLTLIFKKEHKWGVQRLSRYLPVCEDPDEKREHVHVYFPVDLYRMLKMMHDDLNFYSIAQLVREFLRFFLDLVKKYGKNVFREIERIFKRWKDENSNIKLTPHEVVRQLWRIIRHLHGQNKLITIYNKRFSPFWIFHL